MRSRPSSSLLDGTSGTVTAGRRNAGTRRSPVAWRRAGRVPDRCRWRYLTGSRWSGPAPASAARYLQGPAMMTTAQWTTSFLWCAAGNHRHGAGASTCAGKLAPPRPPGPVGPPGAAPLRCCAHSRARSSVGERCLHTAEVGGSIPSVPTTHHQVRAGFRTTAAAGSPRVRASLSVAIGSVGMFNGPVPAGGSRWDQRLATSKAASRRSSRAPRTSPSSWSTSRAWTEPK